MRWRRQLALQLCWRLRAQVEVAHRAAPNLLRAIHGLACRAELWRTRAAPIRASRYCSVGFSNVRRPAALLLPLHRRGRKVTALFSLGNSLVERMLCCAPSLANVLQLRRRRAREASPASGAVQRRGSERCSEVDVVRLQEGLQT